MCASASPTRSFLEPKFFEAPSETRSLFCLGFTSLGFLCLDGTKRGIFFFCKKFKVAVGL